MSSSAKSSSAKSLLKFDDGSEWELKVAKKRRRSSSSSSSSSNSSKSSSSSNSNHSTSQGAEERWGEFKEAAARAKRGGRAAFYQIIRKWEKDDGICEPQRLLDELMAHIKWSSRHGRMHEEEEILAVLTPQERNELPPPETEPPAKQPRTNWRAKFEASQKENDTLMVRIRDLENDCATLKSKIDELAGGAPTTTGQADDRDDFSTMDSASSSSEEA